MDVAWVGVGLAGFSIGVGFGMTVLIVVKHLYGG